MESDTNVLARFPKQRSILPENYRAIYAEHYRRNRQGESPASWLSQTMESWMHRRIAADSAARPAGYSTLEVGAGALNHLKYEPQSASYDVMEPLLELIEKSPLRARVRHAFGGLEEVGDLRYDRIVSIASFEHQCHLPLMVARCGLLLNPGGQLRVAIPSEGTPLWTLGWMLTTGLEFRLRHGLNYGVLMRHEHVNTAAEIASVLRVCFGKVRRSVLGIHPMISFYQFFECSEPVLERCADLIR